MRINAISWRCMPANVVHAWRQRNLPRHGNQIQVTRYESGPLAHGRPDRMLCGTGGGSPDHETRRQRPDIGPADGEIRAEARDHQAAAAPKIDLRPIDGASTRLAADVAPV